MRVKRKREFAVVIEQDEEGYYVAHVHDVRGCHTQAKSLDTLRKRVREVIQLCLEEKGRKPDRLELVGMQRISI